MEKEKKEIGMEKLIELLNEYAEQLKFISKRKIEDNKVVVRNAGPAMSELMLISKSYGFIKWLVENDKIDTDAYKTVYSGDLDKRKTLTMSSGGDEFYQVTEHGVYESLLMLLSTSDTPIDFLCDIIKN